MMKCFGAELTTLNQSVVNSWEFPRTWNWTYHSLLPAKFV